MKIFVFTFLMLFLSIHLHAGTCTFTHTLTELLLDKEDPQIIVSGKVESISFLENGRIINEVSVTKVFRGENIKKRIKVTSGIWDEFQAKILTVGDDYLIVGRPWGGKSTYYSAFVCDRISGNILKDEKGKAKDFRAVQNLKIIEDYFSKKTAKFTGLVNLFQDTFLLLTGKMVKGKQEGIWKNYYLNYDDVYRQISELTYKNGKLHGESQYFFRDRGIKKRELLRLEIMKNGKKKSVKHFTRTRESEIIHYFTSTFKHFRKKTLQKNKTYFSNGQLQLEREITTYNASHPVPEGKYSFRFWSGKYVTYYENGKTKVQGSFFRNAKTGSWEQFNEEGESRWPKDYGKPKVVKGNYSIFFEEGNLSITGKLKNRKKEGVWTYFYEKSTFPYQKAYFKNDTIQDKIEYFNTKTGKLTKIEKYRNNVLHGTSKRYDENQNVIAIENYHNSEKHGKQLEYYANGNLKSERNYEYGKPIGTIKEYYKSGAISRLSTLHDTYADWDFKEYDENGTLVKSGIYESVNRAIGEWVMYKSNGFKKVCNLEHPQYFDPFENNIESNTCRYFDADGVEINEKEYLQKN